MNNGGKEVHSFFCKSRAKALREIISRRNEKAQAVKRAYVLPAADENSESLCDSEIPRRYNATIRSVEGLRKRFVEKDFHKQINAYLKEKNKEAIQINLQFTTKKARTKLKKLYPKL